VKKTRIYLDTSIINFLFADDAPEKKAATVDFFERYVAARVYDVFISPVVLDEIDRTRDSDRRSILLSIPRQYGIASLSLDGQLDKIEDLARAYIATGVIPERKIDDALHVAICTVQEIDILLSWNYQHLANINKERLIQSVNLREGYTGQLRMATPLEVMYEE